MYQFNISYDKSDRKVKVHDENGWWIGTILLYSATNQISSIFNSYPERGAKIPTDLRYMSEEVLKDICIDLAAVSGIDWDTIEELKEGLMQTQFIYHGFEPDAIMHSTKALKTENVDDQIFNFWMHK